MVKFLKAPKITPYTGELEKVSFEFAVPVARNPNSGKTGFEAVDRMVRPVYKGLAEKPMTWSGFEYLGVKRTKYLKPQTKEEQK
jgi:hypothetical protein